MSRRIFDIVCTEAGLKSEEPAMVDKQKGQLRVLVVDSNAAVRVTLVEVLSKLTGLEVQGVARISHIRQALDNWKPQVILLEIKRRDGRGVALVHEILACQPDVQVAVLTSYSDPWERFEAIAAGAAAYLLKEADAEALAQEVLRLASLASHR